MSPENPTGDANMRALLEMLFENNPDGIAYSDAQGVLTMNQAARELLSSEDRGPGPDESGYSEWSNSYGLFLPDQKTPHPPETLPLVRALHGETVRDHEIFCRSAKNPQGLWISVNASPMANGAGVCVFRDVTERKKLEADLAQRNEELAHQMSENNDLIERLRLAVDELSTPVLELWDDILALPVVGVVDTVRSARMMEKILSEVVARRCRAVIIDVTGVDVIDTGTADRFLRIARSIELLGAECVVSGVQPAVAQTLTDLGVSFRGLTTQRNLKRALDFCVARQAQQQQPLNRRGTSAA